MRDATVRPDVARLEDIYEAHGVRLWRAVVLYAGDREIANDAVAEAFAQALRRGDDLQSPERWVWRTAFRIAAGELSRRKREGTDLMDAGYETPRRDRRASPGAPPAHTQAARRDRPALLRGLLAEGDSTDHPLHAVGRRCPPASGRRRLRELLGDDDA